ncbi:tyrosinase [Hirsutella rhossiliensis]|uniref:Tyrosinase n=1 Tax=Hirsutella rhossiliensis TaxID=111463 RepID=A0A9P8N751_9HYPO|nr:tyrosinase [Hirsutella rhossiliensis]KAH0967989.1 tyrosinase [Hirsutella rhossiliensis]
MLAKTLTALVGLGTASLVFAADPYPITGAPVPQNAPGVPLRMNINDLQAAGGPQWDLYLRALSDMQSVNYHDTLSYFQISGIHGRPYIEWNNTGGPAYDDWGGYCPHGEQLFLSWHRPYVLLFEQVLVSHARRIAQTYPPRYRQQYIRAAESLRSPYWDWAAGSGVPSATVPARVTVNYPNGQGLQRRQIDNPLSTFKLPQAVLGGEYGTFDTDDRPRILHCPAPGSYPASANSLMAQRPYRQWVYDVFTRATNFSDFATQSNTIVSLEVIHNSIHWDAACGQQFVMPDLAGFDPLFMLHHSNVDRLWSYWQALRPDQAIFSEPYAGASRFTTPSGTIITPRSPLEPFFARGRLEYWAKSEEQMRQDTTRLINSLYAPNAGALQRRQPQQSRRRYFARIRFDRAHVPKPCQIEVYVRGQHASSIVVAAQPARGSMSAGLPLDKIVQAAEVKAMSNDATAGLLQSDLTVKIVKLDGSSVDSVPSLEVKLEDVQITPSANRDEFPKYGPSKLWRIDARAALQGGESKS